MLACKRNHRFVVPGHLPRNWRLLLSLVLVVWSPLSFSLCLHFLLHTSSQEPFRELGTIFHSSRSRPQVRHPPDLPSPKHSGSSLSGDRSGCCPPLPCRTMSPRRAGLRSALSSDRAGAQRSKTDRAPALTGLRLKLGRRIISRQNRKI